MYSINKGSKWLRLETEETPGMDICAVSRLQRQFATLHLFHTPTGEGCLPLSSSFLEAPPSLCENLYLPKRKSPDNIAD